MTICAIKAKHWVLRHYLWVALGLLVLALAVAFCLQLKTVEQWVGIIAVPAIVVVTLQKQKTEELQLFKGLFTEFNSRYDQLNEKLNELNAIRDEGPEKELEKKERDILFNYFNLCGEEYLFFSQGYIYPEVWRAWHNGMLIFYQNPRIKKLWDEELKTGSYYGLQLSGSSCGASFFRGFFICSSGRRNNYSTRRLTSLELNREKV